jgi:hypothetical protein
MRSALFWEVTQLMMTIPYRPFETTCRSHHQGLRNTKVLGFLYPWRWDRFRDFLTLEGGTDLGNFWTLKMGPIYGFLDPRRWDRFGEILNLEDGTDLEISWPLKVGQIWGFFEPWRWGRFWDFLTLEEGTDFFIYFPLKVGPLCFPDRSVRYYHHAQSNIPEECRRQAVSLYILHQDCAIYCQVWDVKLQCQLQL